MKKLISKIKNKRLKGNVSLLVILILLASSVISLLSINQIQHLITYGNMTFNYFRAFYLAKAWNELALTEIYNRENWFEDTVEHTVEDGIIKFPDIIENNFLWWTERKYEWFNPYFDMEIVSRFDAIVDDVRLSGCGENEIKLKGKRTENGKEISWDGIVLQLFKDDKGPIIFNSNINGLSNGEIENLRFDPIPVWNLMFWLFGEGIGWSADIIVKDWSLYSNNLNSFLGSNITSIRWTRRYLTIKNIWSEDVSFCIIWKDKIPYSHYLVTVRGNYADMEVWLQSVVKKDFPSWSLDLVGMTSSS